MIESYMALVLLKKTHLNYTGSKEARLGICLGVIYIEIGLGDTKGRRQSQALRQCSLEWD